MGRKVSFVVLSGQNSVNFRKAVEESKANPYNYKDEKEKSMKLLKKMLASFDENDVKNNIKDTDV